MIEVKCTCERKKHTAPLEGYIIEAGAVNKLGGYIKNYKKIYMVCDENTYRAAGEKVEEILIKKNKFSHKLILPKDSLPGRETIGDILIHLENPRAESDIFSYSPQPDLILAVGSGTINDSCRVVSYRLNLPYGIVATAPSMDGYASSSSPVLFEGTKYSIKCTTPKFIIGDIDIIKNAPYDMLLAGIGDMLAKYTGVLDWELARDYTGEYYCEKIAGDVIKAADMCLDNGYGVKERKSECIKNIMNGFMVTGLGMAFTGNSRPASGSEHILGHVWELEDVEAKRKPHLHGLEVCEAARIIMEIFKLLYEESDDEHLKELIAKYISRFEKTEKFCQNINMPSPVKDPQRIKDSFARALKLRDRYTVLFYLMDRNILDKYISMAVDNIIDNL